MKKYSDPELLLAFGLGPLIGGLAIFQDYYDALDDVLKAINDRYEQKNGGV